MAKLEVFKHYNTNQHFCPMIGTSVEEIRKALWNAQYCGCAICIDITVKSECNRMCIAPFE